jgi:N-acyl homoserine lactone hydrolase
VRIHPIQTGTVTVRERQRRGEGHGQARQVRTLLDRNWTEPLPILAWLIEHPEGLIMVDTGETARATQPGYFPRWHPYFRRCVRMQIEPPEEAGPQLERLGFSPADVRWVVLTHMHTDHAGGLQHFPRSEVLATRKELSVSAGTKGRLGGYLPHRMPPWLDPKPVDFEGPAFGSFDRSRTLTAAGDVILVPTPGHTPGHMSVAVRTGEGLVMIAGDVSYMQQLMLEGVPDGVCPDEDAALLAQANMRELAAIEPMVYLPTHDTESVRRLAAMEPVPQPQTG